MTIDNPYWDAVKDCVDTDTVGGNPVVGYFSLERTVDENMARSPNRQLLVRRYCWTVPDPDTVQFVAAHIQGGLVDPIAGTGYWAYLLTQLGVDVVCYDLNPGTDLVTNGWHGEDMHAEVVDVGARILLAYNGNRLIYVGDGRGGGTGDDRMHQILETQWTEVHSRQPVLWWDQRDR